MAGVRPTYVAYDKGDPGYNVDWNNIAPSVGFAWRPGITDGFARLILGDPEQATFRGGFSLVTTVRG